MLVRYQNALIYRFDSETVRIEPWGPNALRIRATHEATFPAENWALSEAPPEISPAEQNVQIEEGVKAVVVNGRIMAHVSRGGKLVITDEARGSRTVLEEFSRNRVDVTDPKASALKIDAREFVPRPGADSYRLTARFESLDENEHIYGMGQYQQPYLNLKGTDIELAQRNSQASIPFALSSLGYGLLWNQPAVGRAALSTRVLDCWIVAGDTPAGIVRAYANVVGKPPPMPEYGLGFWQCKLRYQTQDELLQVAREHKRRGLPMDVLVVDYFHWPKEGDWRFDPTFWLDEAEPEYSVYDFDIYRYHLGPNLMVGNIYPFHYAQAFYQGTQSTGQTPIVNLVRCAWVGSQKYGALLWSGDVASSWSSFRNQLSAGLNAGIAGIPWWTTDIGGFHGGNPNDPAFRELFVRWFQWGAFCPVFRLHGDRLPQQPRLGNSGGSHCLSGAPNEVWSYGEEVYGICKKYLFLREKMRGYVREVMDEAHRYGDPVMRPLFYGFPEDERAWEVTDQYLFGRRYLVAPILAAGQRTRTWVDAEGERVREVLEGGVTTTVDAPLDYMPVFEIVEIELEN
ncbi:putative alpha-glucosidase 2 [Podospora aff. communis PSN243]|uniref:Alpha-glucosidase 2 n=1 Tax=Podospora aff. communis PSN243 TaxID=3040156 RepID=A0AAV9GH07_9PEZI|nr:putative alpha-glucosidase 2 [Podospora aff. communis PSN243]